MSKYFHFERRSNESLLLTEARSREVPMLYLYSDRNRNTRAKIIFWHLIDQKSGLDSTRSVFFSHPAFSLKWDSKLAISHDRRNDRGSHCAAQRRTEHSVGDGAFHTIPFHRECHSHSNWKSLSTDGMLDFWLLFLYEMDCSYGVKCNRVYNDVRRSSMWISCLFDGSFLSLPLCVARYDFRFKMSCTHKGNDEH